MVHVRPEVWLRLSSVRLGESEGVEEGAAVLNFHIDDRA